MACDARNSFPATVYADAQRAINVYGARPQLSPVPTGLASRILLHLRLALPLPPGKDIEIDYRGPDVTVENFLRVLTGEPPPPSFPFLSSSSLCSATCDAQPTSW